MAEQYDAVVAGTGMGGLTAASLLAARGVRTLILERQPSVGGYMAGFRRGSYRFDAAANFLGAIEEGGEVGSVLREIGVADQVEFAPVDRSFRAILPDREMNTRTEPYIEALATAFPDHRDAIARFARVVHSIGADIERFERLNGWRRLLVPFCCPRLLRYGRATMGALVGRYLSHPGVCALAANFPATAAPSEVSLLFGATVLTKGQRGGLFYPVGGTANLARLLAEAAVRHGAELRLCTALTAIEHDGRRVRAVRTDSGERIETRAVVAGFNPDDALGLLEGPETARLAKARRRTAAFRYSASAFIVYLGLKPDVDWSKEFFFTTIYETLDLDGLHGAVGRGEMPEQSIVHVSFPCAAGRSQSSDGAPTAKIITIAPYGLFKRWHEAEGEESYRRRKAELADRLIERASRHVPSLRGAVVLREAATPLTLERWTANRAGAMYGLEPTVDQFGPTRWPNVAALKGLYFCGHYSRPAHGIVGTCYSGRFVADRLTR